jgi:hypothetical protein
LAVVLELLEAGGIRHVRFTIRPDDPGVAPMVLLAARRLPRDRCAISFVDYGLVRAQELQLPPATVPVRRLEPDESRLAERFYARCLHPVEHESLADRLTRRRTVLAAVERGRVVGMCVVGRDPFGVSLSLLEHLRIASGTVGEARREVWSALLRAAAAEASETSGWLATLTHPEDRPLARAAGLVGLQPQRYAIVTIEQQAIEALCHCSERKPSTSGASSS